MRLPLIIRCDWMGRDQLIDDDHRVLCDVPAGLHRKFLYAVARKFNRNLRFRLFGAQPYLYTRDDWLEERNPAIRVEKVG